jgi:hypothetical protein
MDGGTYRLDRMNYSIDSPVKCISSQKPSRELSSGNSIGASRNQMENSSQDAIQQFVQDPQQPAHLLNHDNEYLHYQDDWYIIDYEQDNNNKGVPLRLCLLPWIQ